MTNANAKLCFAVGSLLLGALVGCAPEADTSSAGPGGSVQTGTGGSGSQETEEGTTSGGDLGSTTSSGSGSPTGGPPNSACEAGQTRSCPVDMEGCMGTQACVQSGEFGTWGPCMPPAEGC